MTKAELLNAIALKSGMTKKDSNIALKAVFTSIQDALNEGERVNIPGFGSFFVAVRKNRIGRNPKTGNEISIVEKSIIKFKPKKSGPNPPEEGW